MAGDWIKLECTTPDKPEIVRMAATLKIDQDAVVGKLLRVWVWADQNSVAGQEVTITAAFLDRLTNRKGFAASMRSVGWLIGDDGAMTFPNFDRHNGTTAKARSVTNRRVATHRKCNAATVTETEQKPLPEKRREEKNTDLQPEEPTTPPPPTTPAASPRGVSEGKGSDLIPTTEQSKRFAAIFHRRLETPWTRKEVDAYRKLGKVPEEDLAAVETYYAANWPPKREANILRHDLITFLNNWPGEVDRARAMKAKPTVSKKGEWLDSTRKVIPITSPEEAERIRAEALRTAKEFQQQQNEKTA